MREVVLADATRAQLCDYTLVFREEQTWVQVESCHDFLRAMIFRNPCMDALRKAAKALDVVLKRHNTVEAWVQLFGNDPAEVPHISSQTARKNVKKAMEGEEEETDDENGEKKRKGAPRTTAVRSLKARLAGLVNENLVKRAHTSFDA